MAASFLSKSLFDPMMRTSLSATSTVGKDADGRGDSLRLAIRIRWRAVAANLANLGHQLRRPYCIAISAKIAAAGIAEQLRKSTMFVPFHAAKRALKLNVQIL